MGDSGVWEEQMLGSGSAEMGWVPASTEKVVVPLREKDLYLSRDPACSYDKFQYPKRKGIDQSGHFPIAVARKIYTDRGYDVFISAQSKHGVPSYLLEALPGKRRDRDAAYLLMVQVFGNELPRQIPLGGRRSAEGEEIRNAGGDPDLFVQRRIDSANRFFVEVKLEDPTRTRPYRDTINEQQELLFH